MKKLLLNACCAISVLMLSPFSAEANQSDMKAFEIYKISDVLCDRDVYTMVPKSAVIHVPRGMEHKLKREKGMRYVSFKQFMRNNCVWMHKMQVSVSEAKGDSAIDPLRLERLKKLGKVVIAVHKSEPISMKVKTTEAIAQK